MIGRRALLALGAGALTALTLGPVPRARAAGRRRIGIVYNLGGKLDKSFNESAFHGVLAVRAAGDAEILEYEVDAPGERVRALRAAASSAEGVISIGSTAGATAALAQVAAERPDVRFVIIDSEVPAPNVLSITFADHEGAFLAGIMAGHRTQTGIVGFVGGLDVPPIRRFLAGYRQGVGRARPEARVLVDLMEGEARAWNDPFAAYLLARGQILAGADVLFAVAGGSGLGVHQAAADAGVLAIGVDSNQNALMPGTILTSALKRIDRAVGYAVARLMAPDWTGDAVELGLAEGGVDVAMDEHNADLIEGLIPAVEAWRQRIIDGDMVVADRP